MTAAEHAVQPEELMSYLDGELAPERATIVQTHVATCALCQQAAEDLRGVSRDMTAWQVEAAPSTFRAPDGGSTNEVPSVVRRRSILQLLTSRTAVAIELSGLAALAALAVVLPRFELREAPAAIHVRAPTVSARGADKAVVPVSVAGRVEAPAMSAVPEPEAPRVQAPKGPMIVRTATLRIVTDDFERARPAVDRILSDMGGFVGQVDVTGSRGTARLLRATLRVPAARLDAALAELKKLGQVVAESQGGDDVTEQVIDLDARLMNNRNTEKRLTDLLQKRTGDLADVLAAEREIARVREEIERLEAQRKNLEERVSYATLTLELAEERRAELDLGTTSVASRFRNALVDGMRAAADSALEFALFAMRVGPFLLLWAAVLVLPVRFLLRRLRKEGA